MYCKWGASMPKVSVVQAEWLEGRVRPTGMNLHATPSEGVKLRDRVITIRISEQEYKELSALSLIEGESMSSVLRRSIHCYVRSVVESPDYADRVRLARERAARAEKELRRSIDLDETGSIPVLVPVS